jgi:hypothetical protein
MQYDCILTEQESSQGSGGQDSLGSVRRSETEGESSGYLW